MNTNFIVVNLTRPRIESESTISVVSALTTLLLTDDKISVASQMQSYRLIIVNWNNFTQLTDLL